MPVFNNPQQTLLRRGSRILPNALDLSRHPKLITGSAAVQAQDATVVASGGGLIEGTAAVQAVGVQVRARAPDAIADVAITGPGVTTIMRRGRRLVLIDTTVYKNVSITTKEGTASAVSSAATVSIAGTRKITGTAAAVSQDAVVSAVSSEVTGVASANSSDATVSASGSVTTNAAVVAQSQDATVVATGIRTITGTAAVSSQDATASANGLLAGVIIGQIVVQAQPSTVLAVGQRGFSGTATVQAQNATVNAIGEVLQPAIPSYDEIPTLLSRVHRDLSLDLHSYLKQGDEPITFEVVWGELPLGTTLDPATGIVSGKPTVIAFYDLIVRATNITGADDSNQFRWLISDSIPKDGLSTNQNVVTIAGQ